MGELRLTGQSPVLRRTFPEPLRPEQLTLVQPPGAPWTLSLAALDAARFYGLQDATLTLRWRVQVAVPILVASQKASAAGICDLGEFGAPALTGWRALDPQLRREDVQLRPGPLTLAYVMRRLYSGARSLSEAQLSRGITGVTLEYAALTDMQGL